jgi:Tol biopolymer transport system component
MPSGDEQFLIEEGLSSEPYYAPSGNRLLFVTGKRASHAQTQVYEKDLATGEERRLTFQTGSNYGPKYHPREPWFVYASTTDELKENPPLLNFSNEQSALPEEFQIPSEIYIHSLDGLEITRITDRLGYDGNPQFSHDGRRLIWTRAVKGRTQVVALDRMNRVLQQLPNLGANPSGYISATDKNANAWIEWDEALANSKLNLKTSADPKPVEINANHQVTKIDPAFSPDNQYLVWSQLNALHQHFELWAYSLANKCAYMMIGSDSADRRHPVFSPDMKVLTYTHIRAERSRIANLPFVPPTGPCAELE